MLIGLENGITYKCQQNSQMLVKLCIKKNKAFQILKNLSIILKRVIISTFCLLAITKQTMWQNKHIEIELAKKNENICRFFFYFNLSILNAVWFAYVFL